MTNLFSCFTLPQVSATRKKQLKLLDVLALKSN